MTLFLRQRLQHHWITVITGLQGWQQWWQNNVPHCSNSNTYYYFIVYLAWNICIQKTGQYRKCCRQYQLTQVEQRFWNLTYSWLHIKTTWVAFTVPMLILVVVQSLSQVQLFETLWTPAWQASLSFTVSKSLLKLMSIESVCHQTFSISVAFFSSCPQFFSSSGSFPMSQLLASGGQSIGAFSFSPSGEYSRLISFRMDWFALLAVQGTCSHS